MIQVEAPDGVIVEFPDGTSTDTMAAAMRARFGGPPEGYYSGRLHVTVHPPESVPLPPERPRAAQSAAPVHAGIQGAGRGVADTLGLLPDLADMGANAGLAVIDRLSRLVGGPEISYRFPLASDEIAKSASKGAGALGFETKSPSEMSAGERLAYNVNRFGTQAALTGGAGATLATARAAVPLAERLPRFGDALIRAYEQAPVRAVAGDTAAGAAGGAALTASQAAPESARNAGGGLGGVFLDLGAMLAGQHAGGAMATVTTAPRAIVNRVRGALPAREIPYDSETGLPASNREADIAAKYAQDNSVDPARAAAAIKSGAAEYRGMGAPIPAAGALSNDPKLLTLERAARAKEPGEFAARDVALRDAARSEIESVQPQGVNPREATRFFQDTVNARTGAAANKVRAAEANVAAADQGQRSVADTLRLLEGRSAPASEALDRLVIEKGLNPLDTARKADFAAVPRDVTVPGEPFADAASRVRQSAAHLPENAQAEVLPIKRLEDFESYLIRDKEGNIVGVKPISFGTINDLRPILGAEIARARAAGAPTPYLDNLETLRREINKASGLLPEAKTAVQNYERNYAPIFGRGAGEAYRFRQDYNVDRINRTASPPTATAGRFLGTGEGAKEKAAALDRIVQSMADPADKAATLAEVRRYVLSDMTRTIGSDGKISENSLSRWLNGPNGWRPALSQFPDLLSEVDGLLSDVRTGNAQRNGLAGALERAVASQQRTQRQVNTSALSLTLGKEPPKAARAVLESGDPEMAMREIMSEIGKAHGPRRAWERAVTDYLVDRVSSVAPSAVSEGTTALDFGRLTKTLKRYEGALAELYAGEPEKMQALRRTQRLLEPLAKKAGAAAAAGPISDQHERAWKLLEAAVKTHYGILKGGGVIRTLKIWASLAKNEATAADRLITRMMFDPELAAHLLTRKVAEVGSPAWNAKLAKLLRRVQVGREVLGGGQN